MIGTAPQILLSAAGFFQDDFVDVTVTVSADEVAVFRNGQALLRQVRRGSFGDYMPSVLSVAGSALAPARLQGTLAHGIFFDYPLSIESANWRRNKSERADFSSLLRGAARLIRSANAASARSGRPPASQCMSMKRRYHVRWCFAKRRVFLATILCMFQVIGAMHMRQHFFVAHALRSFVTQSFFE